MRARTLAAAMLLPTPGAAWAEEIVVRSSDGTPIAAHFHAATAATAARPVVIVGPGYAGTGERDPRAGRVRFFLDAGYHVLTFDPRGFGRSGGNVQFNSPAYEGRDVSALIDWLARRPEVLLDGPGDPRVGMSGNSYGGGIQYAAAQQDRRIDVLNPQMAWHSPVRLLHRDGAFRAGWWRIICSQGESQGLYGGLFAGQTGTSDTHITSACAQGLLLGTLSAENEAWFAARGPEIAGVARVRAPTLIEQGTVDTLTTLSEAADNHAGHVSAGVPVKMLWFCGGHGICRTGTGPPGHVEARRRAWFARHLDRDRSVDTGPAFEWLADDAVWRAADGYPPARAGTLDARGGGRLGIEPGQDPAANPIAAAPDPTGLAVAFPPVREPLDLIGAPTVRLRYAGTATRRTWVYAQLVDATRGLVVGGGVTPLPLVLDGRQRTVERALEPIAARLRPGARYRLELVASTGIFDMQRAMGSVTFARIEAALPVVDAGRLRPGATILTCKDRRKVVLRIRRRFRVRLRRADVIVGGRRVAIMRSGRRPVTVRVAGRSGGRATVRIVMTLRGGRRVTEGRRYRLCPDA